MTLLGHTTGCDNQGHDKLPQNAGPNRRLQITNQAGVPVDPQVLAENQSGVGIAVDKLEINVEVAGVILQD